MVRRRIRMGREQRRRELVLTDTIPPHAFGPFVRLAADDDRDVTRFGHHGDHSGAGAGEDSAVGMEGVGADEKGGGMGEDGWEGGKEEVRARNGGGGEGFEEGFAWRKRSGGLVMENKGRGNKIPSSIGLESTTITENSLPSAQARKRTFSTTDDLRCEM